MLMLCTVSNSGPKCFPVLWWRDIFTGCSHLNIICIKTSGYKHTVCILVSTADILHHIFNETCIKSFRFSAHFSFSFFSKICLLSNSHACMTMGFTASDSCSVSVHLPHRLFSFPSPYQVTYPLWWHPSKGKLVRKRRLSWCNKLLWLQQNCQRNIIKGLKCFLQPNYLQSFFPFLQYYEQCPTRW